MLFRHTSRGGKTTLNPSAPFLCVARKALLMGYFLHMLLLVTTAFCHLFVSIIVELHNTVQYLAIEVRSLLY